MTNVHILLRYSRFALLFVSSFLLTGAQPARADGADPNGTLVQAQDGRFYGTTSAGGIYRAGTVYRITTHGALSTLYSFTGFTDGAQPIGGLVQGTDGDFYGACAQGGANGSGTLFKITARGQITVLHTFDTAAFVNFPNFRNTEGDFVYGALVQGTDGAFYGTAYTGGANTNGTLFKITSNGVFTLLHTFSALDSNFKNTDGAAPQCKLVQGKDGALYGTAGLGGVNGNGTVFKITTDGTFTTLYSFSATSGSPVAKNSDGAAPVAGVMLGADGNFYGVTDGGGANGAGTIFRISAAGTLTALYSFADATDGSVPINALVQDKNGDLYGTDYRGGANHAGTVFRFSHLGVFTTLHSFGSYNDLAGSQPWAGLVQGLDGKFYGATETGGAYTAGTIFSITRAGALTTLYSFKGVYDGNMPFDSLVLGRDGNLYGTASGGGANGNGALFKIIPVGALATIYSFGATPASTGYTNSSGAAPYAGLTQAPNGLLYGVASAGGDIADGTIFAVSPTGAFRALHSFSGLDGSGPVTTLVSGRDSTLYGVTEYGGLHGNGTVFKITPKGTFTSLYSFSALDSNGYNADGDAPVGGLAIDAHGNLYGTTSKGGGNNFGTVFKVTPQGTFTLLYTFTGNQSAYDGSSPTGSLLLGQDGQLYGTTQSGGTFGEGTVFKITTSGALTTIYSFGTVFSDGIEPIAGLVQGQDGTLYGTTSSGGAWSGGTVFSLTPEGAESILFSFSGIGGPYGTGPYGGVIFGSDGNLYGATPRGGYSYGSVYRLTTGGVFTTIFNFSQF